MRGSGGNYNQNFDGGLGSSFHIIQRILLALKLVLCNELGRMDTAKQAQQGLDIAYEISKILDTGLDKKTLEILIALCETGVHPEVRCRNLPTHQQPASTRKHPRPWHASSRTSVPALHPPPSNVRGIWKRRK